MPRRGRLPDVPETSAIRILVVDDEPDMLFLYRMIFERRGYEVISAGNGQEALTRLGEAQVDLVVTDLMMPVMDGREFIARLHEDARTATVPVVLVTAGADLEATGADVTMHKPFNNDQILQAVSRLLTEVR